MNLLEVNALGISFGGLKAVDNFHVSVKKNELYGLIGPNGAGKTTIFNLLTGVYKPNAGEILLNGKNLVGMSKNFPKHSPFQQAVCFGQC